MKSFFERIRNVIKKILHVRVEGPYTIIQIFGISIRYASRYRKLLYQITQEALWLHQKLDKEFERLESVDYAKVLDIVEESLSTYSLHQKTFASYKDIYKGKTVVLCGSGPTIRYYKPIEGAVHVALNRTFTYDNIQFDYIFIQDSRSLTENILDELATYREGKCVKFVGTQNGNPVTEIPESYAMNWKAFRYNTDGYAWNLGGGGKFVKDISTRSIGNFNTIAFPAMQFILYTNPSKIYLVGCDSARVGHFDRIEQTDWNAKELDDIYTIIVEQWKKLKVFADFNYPLTEIISINPVGLKGIFKDVYTENGEVKGDCDAQ